MIFADKLIKLRKQAGLSQEELADKLNVTRQAISKWEGAQSLPDMQKLIRISKLFDVSADYLIKDEIGEQVLNNNSDKIDEDCQIINDVQVKDYFKVTKFRAFCYSLGMGIILVPFTILAICLICIIISDSGFTQKSINAIIGKSVVMLICIVSAIIIFSTASNQKYKYSYIEQPFKLTKEALEILSDKKSAYIKLCKICKIICPLLVIVSLLPIMIYSIITNTTYANEMSINGIIALIGLVVLVICFVLIFCMLCKMLMSSINRLQNPNSVKRVFNWDIVSLIINICWVVLVSVYLLNDYTIFGIDSETILLIGMVLIFVVFMILFIINSTRKNKINN